MPYEWVFAVPGLSVSGDVGGLGDGGNLFLQRAAAARQHAGGGGL